MTYKEEQYILDSIDQIKEETHLNNLMLYDICGVINTWLSKHPQENEDDFMRNIWANLISQFIDVSKTKR